MNIFISKWNINGTFKLPLIESGTYDFEVDWGDNTPSQQITSHLAKHTYPTCGIYTVRITGTIKGWQVTDTIEYQLLDICQWGCLKLGNNGNYFDNCLKLNISATDAPDLSETTNLCGMFAYCYEFNSPIGHWDISKVTNMHLMFYFAKSFNNPLNTWNVSNVNNMSGMFNFAYAFNQPLDKWDVSKVEDISDMFCFAKSFNNPLNTWNVSNVGNMKCLFSHNEVFNQPLYSWNVSNVYNMNHMFNNAHAFNQPLNTWNVSNVNTMNDMFCRAKSFNQPLNMWNVSNVEKMECLFRNAISFNQPLENWDVSNVKCMFQMFIGASSFNQDISNWNVYNVRNMDYMFSFADAFDSNNRLKLKNWNIQSLKVVKNIFDDDKGIDDINIVNKLLNWSEYTNDIYTCIECSICMSNIINQEECSVFKCKSSMKQKIPHCFHNECIIQWNQLENYCPYCRGIPVLEN